MTKAISNDLTAENISQVMKVLASSPEELTALSKGLSAEGLRQPLGKDERSFTECITHLINGEARSSEMIYQALLADEPFFADLHPDRDIGKLLRFDLLEFSELLAYYKTRRKVLLRVLSGLKESQWGRVVQEQGKKRKESVYWRARTIVMHELDHISDLKNKLSKRDH